MLTTKKWRGIAAISDLFSPWRRGGYPALVLVLGVLLGCSPPGRQNLVRGQQLIREGQPAQAIEPLKEAVSQLATNAPACAQAWNYLGLAYHLAARPAEAAQAYANALAKDFNLVDARFNRGCLLLEQGNLAGAINELTTYTTHRPKDAAGWTQLGTAQLRARLYDAADRSFQHVLELGPGPALAAESYNNLGLSYALRRRPNDAFRYLNAALKLQTNHPPALLNQAIVAQLQLGDRALAAQKYRAYLEVAGATPTAVAVAALATQLEGDLRARQALTNNPPAVRTPTNNAARVTNTNPTPPTVTAPPPSAPTNPAPALTSARPLTPPAPAVRTNPPPTAANPPASTPTPTSIPTNAPTPAAPATNAAASAPVVAPKVAAAIPTNAPPAEPPDPPVEMVRLAPEPDVKPAQDLVTPTKPLASPPASPAPTTVKSQESVTTPTRPPATSPTRTTATEETTPKKKSLAQKLNPLGWFGGGSKEKEKENEKKETKEPSAPAPERSKPVTRLETAAAPTTIPAAATKPVVPPVPAPPVVPRYTYQHPGTPLAGDRALAEEAFRRGVTAQKEGRTADAFSAYQAAVGADPAYFEAQYNLGVAAFDATRWSEALGAFERALAIKPTDPSARLNLALSLERAGYPVDAAAELETLLNAAPDNVEAHAVLAGLYAQKLNDRDKARLHYQKVLQLDPRHPQAAAIRRWLASNR